MARKLTVKQERFAQAFVEIGNASEAYKRVYSTENMNNTSIRKEGNSLLKHPLISPRIAELQAEHKGRHDITMDYLTDLLVKAANLSLEANDRSNLRGAAMDLAKLTGQIVDQHAVAEFRVNENRSEIIDRMVERRVQENSGSEKIH